MASVERSSNGDASGRPNAPPSIALPKGGGAIKGIGEKFGANPVTGTGSMTVPIATSPGRSGFGPQLSLSYDSGAGNGPFGFGWSLSLPAITRKTDKGLPQYLDSEESDVFILSGSEDLVPVLDEAQQWKRYGEERVLDGANYRVERYRPRIEGLFARIERWTNVATGEIHWRSISRDNVTTLYGTDNSSRIFDPADADPQHPTRVFSWLIRASYDDKGNAIVYEYAAEDGDSVDRTQLNERNRVRSANRYLKRVRYGNRTPNRDLTTWQASDPAKLPTDAWLFEVLFDYGEPHYEEIAPDPSIPEDEQHRFVLSSSLPDPMWNAEGRGWTVRPDPFSSHRSGFEVRTYRRCRRVLMFHHIPDLPTGEPGYDGLVRSTAFDYADIDYAQPTSIDAELSHQGSTRFASFIRAVTQSGFVRDDTRAVVVRDGVPYATYLMKSLPPVEFEYSKAVISDEVLDLDDASLENLPAGVDGSMYQWVDLDGEGVSGVLSEQAGAWFYKPSLGGGSFGPMQPVAAKASLTDLSGGRQQLLDVAGDGQLDLVMLAGPTPGFYERTADRDWEPFHPFRQLPNVEWDEPNLRFVDLDGDGHADVLITEQDVFTWHASLAEEGYGEARRVHQPNDEERGPRLVLDDGTQTIYLADMCGDGLTDLVRIRNGEVCYWANQGFGSFASKVTMDNAPWFDSPDQFDQRRVRLADVDGSGATDIIYLGRDGVSIYFNQSGNRLSDPRRLTAFPHVDDISSIATADLLGNGTACLVWSSALPDDARHPMRYVDLMGGSKPHLLTRSINNLGAETQVDYAPSTKFYLADKRAGRPWVTRLPFPVHVVERVVTYDRISGNRFVARYAYHHGFFDGAVEREFRGFGMVEQWDTEEFAALTESGELPPGTNVEASSHVPPVLTKTWFHTGVYLGREHVSNYFAGLLESNDGGEYYREPGLTDEQSRALLLDDTVLPDGLTVDEEREACRALKGSMLRQEVYGVDGTTNSSYPYLVTEQNFAVLPLQPQNRNRHGVYLAHPSESISYHYERYPTDPRVSHALTLKIDGFGNVLRSAVVGYGRRQPDTALSQEDQRQQAQTLLTYAENEVTNSIDAADDYRVPLPSDACTYELTGLTMSPNRSRFTPGEIVDAAGAASAIEYEESATGGAVQKRVIEHVCNYYCANDLTDALPRHEIESLALPFESYKLALTGGMVAKIFHGRVSEEVLRKDGGYVQLEGDVNWWIPTGRIFYSVSRDDTSAQELAFARQHFFLPHRYRDPFHSDAVSTETFVTFDEYDLLMQETCDALYSRVTVGERRLDSPVIPARARQDYRVLQPALVMDPNRNRSEVAFDALGMVAGTAVMGKPEDPVLGDKLTSSFRPDLTRAEIDQFLSNPAGAASIALLDEATSRVVYDLTGYWRPNGAAQARPILAAVVTRLTHASELQADETTKLQVAISYSDGFGRELQKKIQAEPGPVPERGGTGGIIIGEDGQPKLTTSNDAARWVGSGWTVFNNKGKPVRQYEPFFSDTPSFEFDVRVGVSPVLFYDPMGRLIGTLNPDHSWQKLVFDAWRQETWDVNDTVLVQDPREDNDLGSAFGRLPTQQYLPSWHTLRTESSLAGGPWPDTVRRDAERRAAEQTAVHAATPLVVHVDSLGRAFITVAHNKFTFIEYPSDEPASEEFHRTFMQLDIQGNQREIIDAQGRIAMRYDCDMVGGRIHQTSMDAGERWALNDVAGKPLITWDSRGYRLRTAFDALRRPTDSFLQDGGGLELLVGRSTYGETRQAPEAANLRGKLVEQRDQAGIVISDEYDFKGNPLSSSRRLAVKYDTTLDWLGPLDLESEAYTSRTRYDALNRPTQLIAPHSDAPAAKVDVLQLSYSEAGLLEQLHAWLGQDAEPNGELESATASLHAITGIDYDAKGQRERIEYGNGVVTTFTYDPLTFRMVHLVTRRPAAGFADDCPDPPSTTWPGCQVQSLEYVHDPSGNVTYIRDLAQQTIYFRNTRVSPDADYTYDALYRLIEATGREHLGQVGGVPSPYSYDDVPRAGTLHPGDGNAMGRYVERYAYDTVGNILSMQHRGSDPIQTGWTRRYSYKEKSPIEPDKQSNRLSNTTVGGSTEAYSVAGDGYDAHGNMLRMTQLQAIQWDFKDQLQMTRRQAVNDADAEGTLRQGERTWYVYDVAGQRARKVTESAGNQIREERIYIGAFELYRRYGTNELARQTLHIMAGQERIAIVETRVAGSEPGVPQQLVRYQMSNHLGSSSLELDDQGQIISYEEYTPYGSTSYQAVRNKLDVPKRYRHSGNERDEESGLYYHGSRYYSPWLARWTSCDPTGLADGPNPYLYVRANPIRLVDDTGLAGEETKLTKPAVVAALQQQGLPYATEVSFDLVDTTGKVVTSGRFDVMTVDPRTGSLIIPELKGKNVLSLTKNQDIYVPLLESVEGATIRITGNKSGSLGFASGVSVHVNADNFFRLGVKDINDFYGALQTVTGGKAVKHSLLDSTGKMHLFSDSEAFREFLETSGRASLASKVAGGLKKAGPVLAIAGVVLWAGSAQAATVPNAPVTQDQLDDLKSNLLLRIQVGNTLNDTVNTAPYAELATYATIGVQIDAILKLKALDFAMISNVTDFGGRLEQVANAPYMLDPRTGDVYAINMNALSDAPLGSLSKNTTLAKSVFGWYSDSKNVIYREENGKLYLRQW